MSLNLNLFSLFLLIFPGVLFLVAFLLRKRFKASVNKSIDTIIVIVLFITASILLGIYLSNLFYPSSSNALALASIFWIGFIAIVIMFGLKFILWFFRFKK